MEKINPKFYDVIYDFYKKNVGDIKEYYKWGRFPKTEKIPADKKTDYDKAIWLKESLSKNLRKEKEYLDTAYSIIQKWGGINLQKNSCNNERLEKLKENLEKGEYDLDSKVLSSLSKVAAFYDCNKYAVYDSRVAYSLNWIIFREKLKDSTFNMKYFPQPSTRNTNLVKYSHKKIFKKAEYLEKKETYEIYCNLLQSIAQSKNISVNDIEMFLFSAAISDVLNEVKEYYDKNEIIV